MAACKECGAASDDCDALFEALLVLDHSRRQPWGQLHGVSVSCFLLQHSGRRAGTGAGAVSGVLSGAGGREWELVRAYLNGGLRAVEWVVRRARSENSHRGGGLSAPDVPKVREVAPTRFAVTIEEVAVDGTFPADGFADRVAAWAAATVEAWGIEP